jgi:hypothetical protein
MLNHPTFSNIPVFYGVFLRRASDFGLWIIGALRKNDGRSEIAELEASRFGGEQTAAKIQKRRRPAGRLFTMM